MEKGHGWRELQPQLDTLRGRGLAAQLQETQSRFYAKAACRVIVSREPVPGAALRTRWHLSISCPDRYPTWDEIKDARYSLLPLGVTFAQILPPPGEYTNVHPNCFHLWEIEWQG